MSGMSMSGVIEWMAAQAERIEIPNFTTTGNELDSQRKEKTEGQQATVRDLPAHQFPAKFPALREARGKRFTKSANAASLEENAANRSTYEERVEEEIRNRDERRTYRGRTVAMLRRYMRYSIETGRLPSLLGREFFRTQVTSYSVVTFEDRVIFVHDMERCLARLDEFSRQLIARHILQEHDRWATARLLHCNEKTVRRLTPLALDQLGEIMLAVGLMERLEAMERNSCQEGPRDQTFVSDCEEDK
jgi:hypothetical protein